MQINSLEYSIINGKKYKKCKEGQIRNPITNRCNKIKEINDKYSIINGKKYKKCKEGEIRNPITNRCNKIKVIKEIKQKLNLKPYSVSLDKKATKIKKLFMPFINRVSANISDRLRYYFLIKKQLNIKKRNNTGCIKIYKVIDGKPIYRIGNNIIIKNRIGTDSENGIVFLSTFRDKNKKIFKYTCKITKLTSTSKLDLNIQEQLLKSVIKCPHFPILYGSIICNNNINYKDSFEKTHSDDKTIKQDYSLYPNIMKKNKNKDFLITFNELANGDLNMFVNSYETLIKDILLNSYIQIFMSLIFYYKITGKFHCDTHWGNFLYHKIKKGGYFHYKIFNKDYYIENLGYLWVIWDFELSYSIKNNIKSKKNLIYNDIIRYIKAYEPKDSGGWNLKLLDTEIGEEFYELNQYIIEICYKYAYKYDIISLNNLIKDLINYYVESNILLDKIPKESLIINKTPYEFNGIINK
jgi:hypothetical protein